MSERAAITRDFAGIDRDIEKIFLSLPPAGLEYIFKHYEALYGAKATIYAQKTYDKWKKGTVKMSGQTASRLLELIPPVLSQSMRFDLIKRLREKHFRKKNIHLRSSPETWRSDLAKPLQNLVQSSGDFALPEHVLRRACWLTNGDAEAAQSLLAAIEQEGAAVRLVYIDEEMKRIDALIQDIDATRHVSHRLELPQGTITLTIDLPARTFWQKISDWLS